MSSLFITILNMSLTGAFVIATVCFTRFFLKKSPKIISYCLWAVVGFRLIFPFSIESVFSLMPFDAQPIPPNVVVQPMPYANNLLQGWLTAASFMWLAGVAAMLVYSVASFIILKRKLKEAINVEANIYETEIIKTPFVFGIFSPKIYLPKFLASGERKFIVMHEQAHIKRRDHIVKFVAFVVLCIHWFNPFAWLAFLLMSADMEMACDEHVLKELGSKTEVKKGYTSVLLSLATKRCVIGTTPIGFGSGNVAHRIKNILGLKKQSRVRFVTSMVLVIILSMGFGANRVSIDVISYDVGSQIPSYEFLFFGVSCCD